MTQYEVSVSVHETLVANTVDICLFGEGKAWPSIEVLNQDSAATIYFRVDGVAPTVGGADTYVVPPGQSLTVAVSSTSGPPQAQLISSGTPAYSVTGVPAS